MTIAIDSRNFVRLSSTVFLHYTASCTGTRIVSIAIQKRMREFGRRLTPTKMLLPQRRYLFNYIKKPVIGNLNTQVELHFIFMCLLPLIFMQNAKAFCPYVMTSVHRRRCR